MKSNIAIREHDSHISTGTWVARRGLSWIWHDLIIHFILDRPTQNLLLVKQLLVNIKERESLSTNHCIPLIHQQTRCVFYGTKGYVFAVVVIRLRWVDKSVLLPKVRCFFEVCHEHNCCRTRINMYRDFDSVLFLSILPSARYMVSSCVLFEMIIHLT